MRGKRFKICLRDRLKNKWVGNSLSKRFEGDACVRDPIEKIMDFGRFIRLQLRRGVVDSKRNWYLRK